MVHHYGPSALFSPKNNIFVKIYVKIYFTKKLCYKRLFLGFMSIFGRKFVNIKTTDGIGHSQTGKYK